MIELTLGAWAICIAAVVLGTGIQRLAGQGFGMVAAPVLTLAAPDYVPGTVLLLGLLVGTPALPLLVGGIVWIAVLLSVAGLALPIRPATLFGAGMAAGVMGTLTGIGAPPMAILYANVPAARSAATQNVFFAFGMAVSLPSLWAAGVLDWRHLAFAAALAPLVPLTILAVRPLAGRVERGAIRPWALGLAAVAATVLLAHSLA